MAFNVSGTTLVPDILNMTVGDTHTIQALSSTGQPLLGLTWTTSDPTVLSLSTDNPPVLSALVPGHVTIIGGSASADVMVTASAPPTGSVIWSNPGSASGVGQIVPAVPAPTGVADVFAFGNDGTVQTITSDGTTAWTAECEPVFLGPVFGRGLGGFPWRAMCLPRLWESIPRERRNPLCPSQYQVARMVWTPRSIVARPTSLPGMGICTRSINMIRILVFST